MKITIDIPQEFEKHFNEDRFKDSLERIEYDIQDDINEEHTIPVVSGLRELELIEMLIEAFKNAELGECEHETKKHSRFVPFDEDDAKFLVKNGMPLFNGTCSDCGAMCFDDDTYCPECGSILDEE